ncbi:hypothetical protein [Streptomyces catenulae]|uniref:Uncharacterized protein n=1 Tax=Streptomyces catenulae TaxID=66875 RepID=A0ABV2YY94_9ACTN|nr:hypothetical protein [Streptomyces catenulae]
MGVLGPFPGSAERPPGQALDREEADRAVERLSAEYEAIESSLQALQDHAGRRLLEGAELTGVTRERWAATERSLTALWADFDAYTATLDTVRAVRERRRWLSPGDLAELTGLLRDAQIPATGAADGTGPCTLRELVARLNTRYARALDTIVAADAVWSTLPARIDLLAEELRRTRSLAHSVGVRPGTHPSGDDLEDITGELTRLRAEVITDPLAFWVAPAGGSAAPGGGRPDTTRYDRAARALEDVRREIEAVLDVRQDAEARLMRLRDVLSRAERTLTEARQARGEVLAKIASCEVPAVSGPSTALHEQLAAAAGFRRRAQWHRLSPLLDRLEESAEDELLRARESLTAVTAPLAVRAELRGRLDAYRAELARRGLAGDPLPGERYDAARRLLWSAPCDLRAAEAAVARYQRAAAEALAGERPGPGGGA